MMVGDEDRVSGEVETDYVGEEILGQRLSRLARSRTSVRHSRRI